MNKGWRRTMCRFKLTVDRVESGRGVVNYNAFYVEPACRCRWRYHWLVLLPSSVFLSVFCFAVAPTVVIVVALLFRVAVLWCGCVCVVVLSGPRNKHPV